MRMRRLHLALTVGAVLPFAALLLICVVARPRIGAFVAPFLGPWAGVAYGHYDCTMGHAAPLPSFGLAVFGAASGVGLVLARGANGRTLALSALVVWALGWELAAFLSFVNAGS